MTASELLDRAPQGATVYLRRLGDVPATRGCCYVAWQQGGGWQWMANDAVVCARDTAMGPWEPREFDHYFEPLLPEDLKRLGLAGHYRLPAAIGVRRRTGWSP